MELAVRQATLFDLDQLVPLFDAYRRFYRRASEPDRIRRFLKERFEHNQSVIFVGQQQRYRDPVYAALP